MIVQYASDLHLEFPENKAFHKMHPLQPKGDVLLLGGDIVPFAVMDKCKDFFSYVSDNFEKTYWIPGNHEYYHFDLAKKSGVIDENIKRNVHLVNNTTVNLDGVHFIFSTLWSKISPVNQWPIERNMNDFHAIKYNNYRFNSEQFNRLHDESMQFINTELDQKSSGKTVVLTHHVPTFMHYPEKYKGDTLNEAFAVELFDFIERSKVDYWIYGHHHNNTPDFKIGNTHMRTNQLGYVQYGEHQGFNPEKVIGF